MSNDHVALWATSPICLITESAKLESVRARTLGPCDQMAQNDTRVYVGVSMCFMFSCHKRTDNKMP